MKKICTNCEFDPLPTDDRKGIMCKKTKSGDLPYVDDENGDCVFWSKQPQRGKIEYGESTYGRAM